MKNLYKLLFLSLSLIANNFINSQPTHEEKPGFFGTRSLASFAAEKLVNKALENYNKAYEEYKNYNQAFDAFTNTLKGIPEEILYEEIYCNLINIQGKIDIFIRKLVEEFENSTNDQQKRENILAFYYKFCSEAQAEIIISILKEIEPKNKESSLKLADIKQDVLQNLAIYLVKNLISKDSIESLEDNLESISDELSILIGPEVLEIENREGIESKLNFINKLFEILEEKHAISVNETPPQFSNEIQETGMELLKFYSANEIFELKNAIKKLSNETKHKILMYYLENYLISNNNFKDILNTKITLDPQITDYIILDDLIYYLSDQPMEILQQPISEESPTFENDVKEAKIIFGQLFKELSIVYPKTINAMYEDIYHFLPSRGVINNLSAVISKILNDYIYWTGLEFNSLVIKQKINDVANLIIEFYKNVDDVRPLIYFVKEMLSLYIMPLKEANLKVNHIDQFIKILKEIKSKKVFDQHVYNQMIENLLDYAHNAYSNEDLETKGLTRTKLNDLFESLKS